MSRLVCKGESVETCSSDSWGRSIGLGRCDGLTLPRIDGALDRPSPGVVDEIAVKPRQQTAAAQGCHLPCLRIADQIELLVLIVTDEAAAAVGSGNLVF